MGECAFCPNTAALTAEHVYSRWMADLFPGKADTKMTIGKRETVKWVGTAIDWRVRVVCANCNNTWMSNIESKHAKPVIGALITGTEVVPITQQIASSSKWAVLSP